MDELLNSRLEEKTRTLYVRLPKTIRDDKQVTSIFPENVKVKLPRQTSRCCHVVFPTILEMERCQKRMKEKTIDGRKLFLIPVSQKKMNKRKEKVTRKKKAHKKVKITLPKPQKHTINLYVKNIPKGTSVQEIKTAFPECTSLALLKGEPMKPRSAVVKMGNVSQAAAYLKKKIPAPVINGEKVKLRPYKRRSKSFRKRQQRLKEEKKSDSESETEIKEESDEESES